MIKKLVIGITLLAFAATCAEATVKLKIAVVNPSAIREQTTPVKFDLPKGIAPEDIVEKGDMDVGYDFDKSTYYVYQKVTLKPSEKRVLQVELKDIWMIPADEIAFLKSHTGVLMDKLKNTRHSEIAAELSGLIKKMLEQISRTQNVTALAVRNKINLYYDNSAALEEAKDNIGMLENLVIDVGGIVEDRVKVPSTLTVSVPKGKGIGPWATVDIRIKVANPSKDKERPAGLKYHLPQEVTPASVVDAGGLDMAYDFDRECFYVYKEDVMLVPEEERVYIVKIKDIWRVPDVEIEAQEAHAKNIMQILKDSEYYEDANHLAGKIFFSLDKIYTSQNLKVPPPEHIAFYRDNLEIFNTVKEDVMQLEKMANRLGDTLALTIRKAEREEGGGPQIKRKRGYEGVSIIAKTIFRGKAPEVATTWKVIFTIIIFVAIMSVVFFALWHAQVRKDRKKTEL